MKNSKEELKQIQESKREITSQLRQLSKQFEILFEKHKHLRRQLLNLETLEKQVWLDLNEGPTRKKEGSSSRSSRNAAREAAQSLPKEELLKLLKEKEIKTKIET